MTCSLLSLIRSSSPAVSARSMDGWIWAALRKNLNSKKAALNFPPRRSSIATQVAHISMKPAMTATSPPLWPSEWHPSCTGRVVLGNTTTTDSSRMLPRPQRYPLHCLTSVWQMGTSQLQNRWMISTKYLPRANPTRPSRGAPKLLLQQQAQPLDLRRPQSPQELDLSATLRTLVSPQSPPTPPTTPMRPLAPPHPW